MTGKERVTVLGSIPDRHGGLVPGYRTSVLTLILSYPQNRDAKDWAAGNGRLNYCIVQSSIVHCFDGIPLKH